MYHEHGLNPISPLTYVDGTWFASVFPLVYELDEDGYVISYIFTGTIFERVAE